MCSSAGSAWVFLVSQVSIAICNLHAMAEGARLTLLYVDNQQNHDMVGILVPIVSGVLWNVLTRIGCLDRFLHCVSPWSLETQQLQQATARVRCGLVVQQCCLGLGENKWPSRNSACFHKNSGIFRPSFAFVGG